MEDIQADVEKLHRAAFDPLGLGTDLTLKSLGRHSFRSQENTTGITPDHSSFAAGGMERGL